MQKTSLRVYGGEDEPVMFWRGYSQVLLPGEPWHPAPDDPSWPDFSPVRLRWEDLTTQQRGVVGRARNTHPKRDAIRADLRRRARREIRAKHAEIRPSTRIALELGRRGWRPIKALARASGGLMVALNMDDRWSLIGGGGGDDEGWTLACALAEFSTEEIDRFAEEINRFAEEIDRFAEEIDRFLRDRLAKEDEGGE